MSGCHPPYIPVHPGKSDIEKLQERIEKLEKDISNWEEEFYFLKDRLRNYDSKPHQCPVCKGIQTFVSIKIEEEYEASSIKLNCVSCKGSGIVWG